MKQLQPVITTSGSQTVPNEPFSRSWQHFLDSFDEQFFLLTLHGQISHWMNVDFVESSQRHANTALCQETDPLLSLIDEHLIVSLQLMCNIIGSPATAVQLCLMCLLPA
jgi:hypothetical protein